MFFDESTAPSRLDLWRPTLVESLHLNGTILRGRAKWEFGAHTLSWGSQMRANRASRTASGSINSLFKLMPYFLLEFFPEMRLLLKFLPVLLYHLP